MTREALGVSLVRPEVPALTANLSRALMYPCFDLHACGAGYERLVARATEALNDGHANSPSTHRSLPMTGGQVAVVALAKRSSKWSRRMALETHPEGPASFEVPNALRYGCM